MKPEIISGIFSLTGVLIGSITSIIGIYISNRINRKKQIISDALDQIIGYWNLEEEMAQYISRLEKKGRAVKTVKEDFREKIYNSKGIRPTMTESTANRLKKTI